MIRHDLSKKKNYFVSGIQSVFQMVSKSDFILKVTQISLRFKLDLNAAELILPERRFESNFTDLSLCSGLRLPN